MSEEHSFDLLELPAIRAAVAELCLSEEGRELLADQEVSTSADTIRRRLDFVGAVRRAVEAESLPSLSFPPVAALLPKLSKEGTVAEGAELAAIGLFTGSAMQLRGYLRRESAALREGTRQGGGTGANAEAPERGSTEPGEGATERHPAGFRAPSAAEAAGELAEFAESLPDLLELSKRISYLLNADGTVNEDHVPELKAIRREIQHLRGDVDALTTKYLSDDRSIWQADVPTQRDGRTVLPLKANYRGRVTGIVHELSATGATLFIEPMDIVEKNNQIVEQDNRYRREVHRVLRDLSELVRARLGEVGAVVERIALFDSIHARARYAVATRSTRAVLSERRVILSRARHPLLGSSAVPIDFELGDSATTMIITGANAGGKTVSLKTVGLLALMNQWGMEIPAEEGCELPVFDRVLVDIGDDQSIANSLSTFSGHMKAVSAILSDATASSLVLLDEIGSGTDPAEGSALAMAVLDDLLDKKAMVVATTHHGVIKRYGLSRPGIVNASVSFDAATLSPTYELVIGRPGESHALEIASRSRIPEAILRRAHDYFEEQRTDLDRAADELAARQRQLDEAEASLAKERREAAARAAELRRREERLDEERENQRRSEYGELKAYVIESRRTLENLVRELRTGEVTREKTRRVKSFIDKIDEKLTDEERRAERTASRRRAPRPAEDEQEGVIEPGAEVFVGEKRRRGTVLRRERGDRWLVAVNTLRLTVSAADLAPARRRKKQPTEAPLSVVVAESGGDAPALELDLRGMRLEEAVEALERQLDRAVLAGIPEFSVIHGKGEGVLQQGVHRALRASSAVSEFHFSPPEAGGFGKTIVTLKR